MPCPQEQALLARAKSGDQETFARLCEKSRPFLTHVCQRFSGLSPEDARDLVQETFLRAQKGLASFRGDSSFSTWLVKIAGNLYLNAQPQIWRRRGHIPWEDIALDLLPAQEDATARVLDRVFVQQLLAALHKRLEAISPRTADRDIRITVLTYQMEMTSQEVAHQLGMTDVNVRKRLREVIKPAMEAVRREFGK